MKTLGINIQAIKGDQLSGMSTDDLNRTKKDVKNELKKYDNEFQAAFGRQPSKTEKEDMRPLYMYYKIIKQQIDNRQKESGPNKIQSSKPGIKHPNDNEREILEKKIEETKKQRQDLRILLDNFQKDFITRNNRKIKYNKDIAPVADDFKLYKDLKKVISDLEEKLATLLK